MRYGELVRWSRRQAMAMGLVASAGAVGFTGSMWGRGDRSMPGSTSYRLGRLGAIDRRLDVAGGLITFPQLQAHLVRYDPTPESRTMYADSPPGLLLLSWVCPHLGCKLPMCESSAWFECPCHGARFNGIGEYKFGPPPRGMDRYALRLDAYGEQLLADTRTKVLGPPRGVDTVGQSPAGPHCVG